MHSRHLAGRRASCARSFKCTGIPAPSSRSREAGFQPKCKVKRKLATYAYVLDNPLGWSNPNGEISAPPTGPDVFSLWAVSRVAQEISNPNIGTGTQFGRQIIRCNWSPTHSPKVQIKERAATSPQAYRRALEAQVTVRAVLAMEATPGEIPEARRVAATPAISSVMIRAARNTNTSEEYRKMVCSMRFVHNLHGSVLLCFGCLLMRRGFLT